MAYVPVKVYRNNEIRRFILEGDENRRFSFQRLLNQLHQVYPGLDTSRVQVAWKDSDGDLIVMSTDLELVDAVKSLPAANQMLRIQLVEAGAPGVTQQQQQQPTEPQQTGEQQPDSQEPIEVEVDADPTRHRRVFCDGCRGGIWGIRYKCLTCPDYDLCSDCTKKALHDDHPMIRIASPHDKTWKPAFFAAQGPFPMGPPFFHGGHHRGHWGHGKHHHHHHRGGRHGRQEWGQFCPRFQEQEARPDQAAAQEANQQAPLFNQQEFARDLNETLSSVLTAFGIPVATPEATGAAKPVEATASSAPAGNTASASGIAVHSNPRIAAALNYMLAMGYKNDGGWLTRLLEEKRGDVSAVLDVLHPTQGHH